MGGFNFTKFNGVRNGGATVSVDITDVLKTLGKVHEQSERAMKATVQDVKRRAPGWIRKAIKQDYTVEASEIKKAMKTPKKTGTFQIAGIVVDNITFEYKGRTLTPVHFNMSPRSRGTRRKYTITAVIKTGRRQRLTGKSKWARPPFLAPTGGAGTVQIPFQRDKSLRENERLPIHSVKTLSVPQMISSQKEVKPNVEQALNEGIGKRMMAQVRRFVLK